MPRSTYLTLCHFPSYRFMYFGRSTFIPYERENEGHVTITRPPEDPRVPQTAIPSKTLYKPLLTTVSVFDIGIPSSFTNAITSRYLSSSTVIGRNEHTSENVTEHEGVEDWLKTGKNWNTGGGRHVSSRERWNDDVHLHCEGNVVLWMNVGYLQNVSGSWYDYTLPGASQNIGVWSSDE